MVKSENSPDKLTIDGGDYFWKVRHGWLVDSGVGIKGISISVWRRPGSTRELVIDFPFSCGQKTHPGRCLEIIAQRTLMKSGPGGLLPVEIPSILNICCEPMARCPVDFYAASLP